MQFNNYRFVNVLFKNYLKIFCFICLFGLIGISATAQQYYRFSADFSIKIKSPAGQQLTMGKVYYDSNFRKIVYQITFPAKETLVTLDTNMYRIVNGKLVNRQTIPAIARFTVFHFALTQQLADYGLKNSNYKVENVEQENDMVITTWLPPTKLKDKLGKILVSTKNKQLYGIVFFNPKGEWVSKQFFSDYQNCKGVLFPCEIIQITGNADKETYEVTTYRNITINEKGNDINYNAAIPVN